ncbi:hypothetical protein Pse7367_3648 [Thalassoporum mexicanum PCC 7367]|uniref:hypothetical protein n=1 Tax=Thalassoporum mexicanum TaxID=3457544 RepID=UPI00029FFC88|nr:hypothetical protein [Pseudanabaena sp. PCC 7367]AFY71881.1 hypothetical protein Pse7367_3648 [Pseudanabaena sp. PCC 7367]
MTSYRDQLHPWCILLAITAKNAKLVSRFRRCHEAQAHIQALQRMNPEKTYKLVFDSNTNIKLGTKMPAAKNKKQPAVH